MYRAVRQGLLPPVVPVYTGNIFLMAVIFDDHIDDSRE